MGAILPKAAVTPIVAKNHGGTETSFRVGFAEMNGWRRSMEDAHVVEFNGDRGFFGVFDGHGGPHCSLFIAKRLKEELHKSWPKDDAAVTELMLRLDKEFLETKQSSGSTGTFVFVDPPLEEGGKRQLRVGNIGDSRVLLSRASGSIVEGAGTDGGLTEDHKPDLQSERDRIERTGGHVAFVQGVARVNGDLAVSRSFGDAQHKETGGPGQADHPVSAVPEHFTTSCDPTDFLLLVCDGISEGEFPNREVVAHVAEALSAPGGLADPSSAAASACKKALECNSKDNLSCMIVLFGGGDVVQPPSSRPAVWLTGPFSDPCNDGFRKAYEAMAGHAGLTLAQAVELRYDEVCKEHAEATAQGDQERSASSKEELGAYKNGPPSDLAPGSTERTEWFAQWLSSFKVEKDPDPATMTRQEMLNCLDTRPDLIDLAAAQGILTPRRVRVAGEAALKLAMEKCPSLKWSEAYAPLCGAMGRTLLDDPSDGTTRVSFPKFGIGAWFPTSAIKDLVQRLVRVAPLEQLRSAMEALDNLKWSDALERVAGQLGKVLEDDESDGTSQVGFASVGIMAWLPSSVLTDADSEECETTDGGEEADGENIVKRQRVSSPERE